MPLFRSRRRSPANSLLLVAVGAVAGVALGALLAERVGGIDKLLARTGGGGGRSRRWPSFRSGDAHSTDEFRSESEQDSELASDAIAHMHVRGRRADLDDTQEIGELETLEERVLEAFRNDPILAERAVDIGALDGGTIELTGWVRAASEIGHALTLARGVPGVHTVIDRLAVRGVGMGRDHSAARYADVRVDLHSASESAMRAD